MTVDAQHIQDQEEIECSARSYFPNIPLRFVYYSALQHRVVRAIGMPCPYAWLSWCLGIREVKTKYLLIHDYDALILGNTLRDRYEEFRTSNAAVQGISWYAVNGIVPEDRLATTFELFCDARWLRSFAPIDLFNRVRRVGDRSIHYDITLDIQHRFLSIPQRQVMPMNMDELVHPSQMIHQYTMFTRYPAKPLACFAVPLIPFFAYLGGDSRAIGHATEALERSPITDVKLLGDHVRVNLTRLDIAQVDWALKQIVQAAVRLSHPPEHAFYRYGEALYRTVRARSDEVWRGDFTDVQRHWIEAARA